MSHEVEPGMRAQHVEDLFEALGVVVDQRVDPRRETGEAVLVRGQHLVDRQVAHGEQRLHEVAQGVDVLLAVHGRRSA